MQCCVLVTSNCRQHSKQLQPAYFNHSTYLLASRLLRRLLLLLLLVAEWHLHSRLVLRHHRQPLLSCLLLSYDLQQILGGTQLLCCGGGIQAGHRCVCSSLQGSPGGVGVGGGSSETGQKAHKR